VPEKVTGEFEVERRPRGVIRIVGPDAAAYLQGQISQDVESLDAESPAWSLLLSPNGKLVAWFRIRRLRDDEFMLDMEPDVVGAAVARLTRFKLRTNAEIIVEENWTHRSSLDHGAPTADDGLVADLSWPGFNLKGTLVPGAPPDGVRSSDVIQETRIRAAMPMMGVDIDAETIPAEGGNPLIDLSVSFTKGCYTGQELVARIDSRGGNVPRPLRVLESAEPIAVGAAVEFDGQEIGNVTSAVGTVALARILRKADIGSAVTVGGIAARVIAPTG
jgi:folate-binding protein YgfZ